jgi:ribosomal protein L37AE/L43A
MTIRECNICDEETEHSFYHDIIVDKELKSGVWKCEKCGEETEETGEGERE